MKNGHSCTYQMQRYYFLTKTNTSSSTISENEKEFLHRNMEILLTGIRICRVLTRHAYKHAIIDHFICIMATNQPRPAPLLSAFACSLGSPFIHFFLAGVQSKKHAQGLSLNAIFQKFSAYCRSISSEKTCVMSTSAPTEGQ